MERIDLQELRELVEFLKESGIAEFELEREDQHVKLKFESAFPAPAVHAAAAMPQIHAAAPPVAAAPAPPAAPAVPAAAPEEELHVVKSPIVGTYYESSAPGSPAFAKAGDSIDVGQTLCIVEAMKLMNEIESDIAGEIVKVIAKNGQPVEYGQPLFAVRAR